MFGICALSIIPCRKKPSSKSEMLTQLLFGEHFEILEEKNEWCYIRNAYDTYESWVNKKQIEKISKNTYKEINDSSVAYTNDLVQVITDKTDKSIFPVVVGSNLPFYKNHECSVGETKYLYEGQVIQKPKTNKKKIIETAYLFLNSPYLWGGRSPFGIDCSGFTQIVFKLNGLKLKRDAHQQAEQGTPLSFVEEAEPGDLAFFDNELGKITHVGIILKERKIIHSSGKVRIDPFDHQGIFNAETRQYTHNLRIIKKMI